MQSIGSSTWIAGFDQGENYHDSLLLHELSCAVWSRTLEMAQGTMSAVLSHCIWRHFILDFMLQLFNTCWHDFTTAFPCHGRTWCDELHFCRSYFSLRQCTKMENLLAECFISHWYSWLLHELAAYSKTVSIGPHSTAVSRGTERRLEIANTW